MDNRPIYIGNQVLIASNVQIYTSSHPVLPQERLVADWKKKGTTFFRTFAKPVTIEDGVWIGGGAILLPGVTIGKNSVIGAGALSHAPYQKIVSQLEIHAVLYAGYDNRPSFALYLSA